MVNLEKVNKDIYLERQKWFIDRIGKTIFRNKNGCKCEICESVYQEGLLLMGKQHAYYAMDCEGESWINNQDGFRYFDTKKEVIEFEKELTL